MTFSRSLLLLLALWVAVYLTGLGSREIKGEEGRRILPALAMIDSGDWLVPRLNGQPYLRKPPLANWAIASSVHLTGHRSEWSVRLPSALSALVAALVLFVVADRNLGRLRAVAASAMLLTTFGLMEKGRIAEIEAIYVALTASAILAWWTLLPRGATGGWLHNMLPWLASAPLLGLGLLAKGPLNILFFTVLAASVVYHRNRARDLPRPAASLRAAFCLLSPGALFAWIVAAGIFAAWALPYFNEIPAAAAAGEWREQTAGRLMDQFDFTGWVSNIPRALSDLLPWVLLMPLLWRKGGRVSRDPDLRGLRDGAAMLFVGMLLVPGVLPRYLLPLSPVWMLLAAAALDDLPPRVQSAWARAVGFVPPRSDQADVTAIKTAALAAVLIALLAFVLPPFLARGERTRSSAASLDALLPSGTSLHAIDIGYQPLLFYLRTPAVFLTDEKELRGRDPAFVLAPEKVAKKMRRDFESVEVVLKLSPPNAKPLVLIHARGNRPED